MEITLLKSMADDLTVINAARVSLDQHHDEWVPESDDGLLGWLMKKRHGSPFEHGYFQFRVEAPIFVFREWHRHRVGHSYNEMSARYVELPDRFYSPAEWRSQVGKPGAYTYVDLPPEKASEADAQLVYSQRVAWQTYKSLMHLGVAKEQARAVLPVGIYSQMYWSCNPRSLMHFLGLRNKPDAQKEIRDLAAMAEVAFLETMPVTAQAFIDAGRVAP